VLSAIANELPDVAAAIARCLRSTPGSSTD
jgi:hypothetical protein